MPDGIDFRFFISDDDDWDEIPMTSGIMIGDPIMFCGDSVNFLINKSNEIINEYWGTSSEDGRMPDPSRGIDDYAYIMSKPKKLDDKEEAEARFFEHLLDNDLYLDEIEGWSK